MGKLTLIPSFTTADCYSVSVTTTTLPSLPNALLRITHYFTHYYDAEDDNQLQVLGPALRAPTYHWPTWPCPSGPNVSHYLAYLPLPFMR